MIHEAGRALLRACPPRAMPWQRRQGAGPKRRARGAFPSTICGSSITATGSKAGQKSRANNLDLHTTAEQASQPHGRKGNLIGRVGGLPAEGRFHCGRSLRGRMKAQRLFLQALFSGSTTPERLFSYPTKERAFRPLRFSRLYRDNRFPTALNVDFPFFPSLLVVHDPKAWRRTYADRSLAVQHYKTKLVWTLPVRKAGQSACSPDVNLLISKELSEFVF